MLADLDLTSQRSAQLRPIYVPYIRVFSFFGGGVGAENSYYNAKIIKRGVCAAVVRQTAMHILYVPGGTETERQTVI